MQSDVSLRIRFRGLSTPKRDISTQTTGKTPATPGRVISNWYQLDKIRPTMRNYLPRFAASIESPSCTSLAYDGRETAGLSTLEPVRSRLCCKISQGQSGCD